MAKHIKPKVVKRYGKAWYKEEMRKLAAKAYTAIEAMLDMKADMDQRESDGEFETTDMMYNLDHALETMQEHNLDAEMIIKKL